MPTFSSDHKPGFVRFAFYAAAALALLLMASPLQAQVGGNVRLRGRYGAGWTSFYGAVGPTNTTAAAYTGTHSLMTTTSASGTGGPQINLTSVLQGRSPVHDHRLGQAGQRRDGDQRQLHHCAFRPLAFLQRRHLLRHHRGVFDRCHVGSLDADRRSLYGERHGKPALDLYAQLLESTPSQTFYLDDVVITETAPPPAERPVASYTWSDGGLDGWTPFGSVTLTNALPSPQDPMGDAHALLTTGRSATYEGPSLKIFWA